MKRSPLKRKSKSTQRKAEDKLWELCKLITRKRHGNTCYTCLRSGLSGSNWHTGHMWAKGSLGASMKYDLRILRPQCYNCNMNLGGMGAVFHAKMVKENGQNYMDQLERDKQVTVKALDHYLKLINEYQEILKNLDEN